MSDIEGEIEHPPSVDGQDEDNRERPVVELFVKVGTTLV